MPPAGASVGPFVSDCVCAESGAIDKKLNPKKNMKKILNFMAACLIF
jgi:hypothetical protein